MVPSNACVCGHTFSSKNSATTHRHKCPQWKQYQKTLPVKCEGCGLGFETLFSKRAHTNSCAGWKAWHQEKEDRERWFPCPSCGELFKGRTLGLHLKKCPGPWTKKDWEAYSFKVKRRRIELYEKQTEEAKDYIRCAICGERFRKLSFHVAHVHKIKFEQYLIQYGGPKEIPSVQEKAKATWMAHYGVSHPRKIPEINARMEAARRASYEQRFGSPSVVAGRKIPPKKTKPERWVDLMTPETVYYTGDFSYWIRCQGETVKVTRNPDFVVYDESSLAQIKAGIPPNKIRSDKIIEVLGEYWHGAHIKSLYKQAYEKKRIAEYDSVNIKCLLLWENDILNDLPATRKRLQEFIQQPLTIWKPKKAPPKPTVTTDMVIAAIHKYHVQHGHPPSHASGDATPYLGIPFTWGGIDSALRNGSRGLPGKTQLSRLIRELGLRIDKPDFTPESVRAAVQRFHAETGEWPTQKSGDATKYFGFPETWKSVYEHTNYGGRGLSPGCGSLMRGV